jgi:hypothetical protein
MTFNDFHSSSFFTRIHTSYVSVEPKRRKQSLNQGEQDVVLLQPSRVLSADIGEDVEEMMTPSLSRKQPSESPPGTAGEEALRTTSPLSTAPGANTASTPQSSRRGSSSGRELRRARIVVTVRRTESYKRWLEENPLQAILASEVDEEAVEAMGASPSAESLKSV